MVSVNTYVYELCKIGSEGTRDRRETRKIEASVLDRVSERRSSSRSKFRGHCHQCGKRPRLHLAHDLTAVCLHGYLADAKFAADLLVQQTGDDQCHHLTFTRRE